MLKCQTKIGPEQRVHVRRYKYNMHKVVDRLFIYYTLPRKQQLKHQQINRYTININK